MERDKTVVVQAEVLRKVGFRTSVDAQTVNLEAVADMVDATDPRAFASVIQELGKAVWDSIPKEVRKGIADFKVMPACVYTHD